MPWTPSTPQPQDTISSTTGLISGNFTAINYWTGVDHTIIDAAGLDEGKHNKVTLMSQAAAPPFTPNIAPLTGVSALGLYAKDGNLPNGIINTTTQLYAHIVRKDAGANYTTQEVPFTASILSNTLLGPGTGGWSYLPSGLIIQWGKVVANNALNTLVITPNPPLVSFQFQIPFPTQCLNVQLTQSTTSSSDRGLFYSVHSFTPAGFRIDTYRISTIVASGPFCEYNYFAIGY